MVITEVNVMMMTEEVTEIIHAKEISLVPGARCPWKAGVYGVVELF